MNGSIVIAGPADGEDDAVWTIVGPVVAHDGDVEGDQRIGRDVEQRGRRSVVLDQCERRKVGEPSAFVLIEGVSQGRSR